MQKGRRRPQQQMTMALKMPAIRRPRSSSNSRFTFSSSSSSNIFHGLRGILICVSFGLVCITIAAVLLCMREEEEVSSHPREITPFPTKLVSALPQVFPIPPVPLPQTHKYTHTHTHTHTSLFLCHRQKLKEETICNSKPFLRGRNPRRKKTPKHVWNQWSLEEFQALGCCCYCCWSSDVWSAVSGSTPWASLLGYLSPKPLLGHSSQVCKQNSNDSNLTRTHPFCCWVSFKSFKSGFKSRFERFMSFLQEWGICLVWFFCTGLQNHCLLDWCGLGWNKDKATLCGILVMNLMDLLAILHGCVMMAPHMVARWTTCCTNSIGWSSTTYGHGNNICYLLPKTNWSSATKHQKSWSRILKYHCKRKTMTKTPTINSDDDDDVLRSRFRDWIQARPGREMEKEWWIVLKHEIQKFSDCCCCCTHVIYINQQQMTVFWFHCKFCLQEIVDGSARITISFFKSKELGSGYGGDWVVRVLVQPIKRYVYMTKKEKNQAWLVAVSCAFFFFWGGRIILKNYIS